MRMSMLNKESLAKPYNSKDWWVKCSYHHRKTLSLAISRISICKLKIRVSQTATTLIILNIMWRTFVHSSSLNLLTHLSSKRNGKMKVSRSEFKEWVRNSMLNMCVLSSKPGILRFRRNISRRSKNFKLFIIIVILWLNFLQKVMHLKL